MAAKSFAAIVRTDVEFKGQFSQSRLSQREKALKNLLVAIGERELGKLRQALEQQKGETEIQKERLGFAGFLLHGARSGGRLLVTPFAEWGQEQRLLPSPTEQVVDPPELDIKSEHEASAAGDAPASAEGDASREIESAMKRLPASAQVATVFLKRTFGHLSPLSTAVLFLITISSSIAIGTYARNQAVSSCERARKSYSDCEKQNATLLGVNEQLQKCDSEKTIALDRIGSLEWQLDQLGEQKESDAQIAGEALATAQRDCRATIASLKGSANPLQDQLATTQETLGTCTAQLNEERGKASRGEESLRKERKSFETQTAQQQADLDAGKSCEILTGTLRGEIAILTKHKTNYSALESFALEVVRHVEGDLLSARRGNLSDRKRTFKQSYSDAWRINLSGVDAIAIPRSVE